MGANVMRQDDSYSFEIIKHTIDAVIPTLVSVSVLLRAFSIECHVKLIHFVLTFFIEFERKALTCNLYFFPSKKEQVVSPITYAAF